MSKTQNYNLHLYNKTEKFRITSETDSLNANMKIIDKALGNTIQKEIKPKEIDLLEINSYDWKSWKTIALESGEISDITRYMTTGYIAVAQKEEIKLNDDGKAQFYCIEYDNDNKFITIDNKVLQSSLLSNGIYTYTIQNKDTKKIRITTVLSEQIKINKKAIGSNSTFQEVANVKWGPDKELIGDGTTQTCIQYCVSNKLIPIDSDIKLSGNIKFVAFYDDEKNYLGCRTDPAILTEKPINSETAKNLNQKSDINKNTNKVPASYIRISYDIGCSNCSASTELNIPQLKDDWLIETLKTDYDYKNMLTNKNWYVFGDNFSAGTGTSKLEMGKYMGKPKAYPYFIGNRCGINIINFAKDGKTMTSITNYNNNCCADEISNNLTAYPDSPPDYITLFFGANDWYKGVTIEEDIDSNIPSQYYGAWNQVLTAIYEKYPTAHIGIIIANCNGTSDSGQSAFSKYVEATKKIAKRWGIPYLDLAEGEQVPLLFRTLKEEKEEVCDTAINARKNAFMIPNTLSTGSNPNEACHEYESYFIENWLMSI